MPKNGGKWVPIEKKSPDDSFSQRTLIEEHIEFIVEFHLKNADDRRRRVVLCQNFAD